MAFSVPALVAEIPSISMRPSSRNRSSTPQAKALCDPPPWRARLTVFFSFPLMNPVLSRDMHPVEREGNPSVRHAEIHPVLCQQGVQQPFSKPLKHLPCHMICMGSVSQHMMPYGSRRRISAPFSWLQPEMLIIRDHPGDAFNIPIQWTVLGDSGGELPDPFQQGLQPGTKMDFSPKIAGLGGC